MIQFLRRELVVLSSVRDAVRERITSGDWLTWPLMISVSAVYLLTSALFANRIYDLDITQILGSSALSNFVAICPVVAIKFLARRQMIRVNLALLAIGALVFGVARELILSQLNSLIFERSFVRSPASYLISGLVAVYVVFSHLITSGTIAGYKESQKRFHSCSSELIEFRKREKQILDSQTEHLKKKTYGEIGPRLLEIRRSLRASNTEVEVIRLIQHAIKFSIRPLGRELHIRRELKELFDIPTRQIARNLVRLPSRINPRHVFNPTIAVLLFSPLFIAGEVSYRGLEAAPFAGLQIAASYLIQLTLKFLMPNRKLPTWFAAVTIVVYELFGDLISTAISFSETLGTNLFAQRYIETVSLGPFWFLVVAYLVQTQLNLEVLRLAIVKIEEQIKSEKNHFEQKLWIARRNWSYLIHGTIQSILTSVLIRASQGLKSEQEKIELENELEHALLLMENPPKPDADLGQMLSDLQVAWMGVAQLNASIEKEASKLLSKRAELRFATNEIIREGVSNAVKHGGAKIVDISVRVSGRHLQIALANPSVVGIASSVPSLGSLLLDELSSSWSLTQDKENNRVILVAELLI